jgi:hypothetical protein
MSTRDLPGGKKWLVPRTDNLGTICEPMSENLGASTSRNPKGLHGLYRDNLTLLNTIRAKDDEMWGTCSINGDMIDPITDF